MNKNFDIKPNWIIILFLSDVFGFLGRLDHLERRFALLGLLDRDFVTPVRLGGHFAILDLLDDLVDLVALVVLHAVKILANKTLSIKFNPIAVVSEQSLGVSE